MKKYELLQKAKHYYTMQQMENNEKGDTMKRREYIQFMCEYMRLYKEQGGKHLQLEIYQPLNELYNYYYEELIFTPTIEDIQEMKYWL